MNWIKRIWWTFVDMRRSGATGYLKDHPDDRDYLYKDKFRISGSTKNSVDLHDKILTPIRDQSTSESCVGFGMARAFEYLICKKLQSSYVYQVSPLYNWYWARVMRGWESQNTGVYPRDALSQAYKKGWVPERVMPFTKPWTQAPEDSDTLIGEMIKKFFMEETAYYFCTPEQVKYSLNDGWPVQVAVMLNSSWYGNTTGKILDKPNNGSSHYVLATGYDDEGVWIDNSWGTRWGLRGRANIPWEVFLRECHEAIVIRYKA